MAASLSMGPYSPSNPASGTDAHIDRFVVDLPRAIRIFVIYGSAQPIVNIERIHLLLPLTPASVSYRPCNSITSTSEIFSGPPFFAPSPNTFVAVDASTPAGEASKAPRRRSEYQVAPADSMAVYRYASHGDLLSGSSGLNSSNRTFHVVDSPGASVTMPVSIPFHSSPNGS